MMSRLQWPAMAALCSLLPGTSPAEPSRPYPGIESNNAICNCGEKAKF